MTMQETERLATLLEKAKRVTMTTDEVVEQRRSFAYGNSAFENPKITKKMIEEEAKKLGM